MEQGITSLRVPEAEIAFRPIRPADNAALSKIIKTVVREHGILESDYLTGENTEIDDIASLYQSPACAYWVIEDAAGRLLGGGGYSRLPGSSDAQAIAEVQKMYFLPECRGRGAGRALLERILDAAKADGYRAIYIESHPKLTRAIALYEGYGFTHLAQPLGCTGHASCSVYMRRELG